MSTRLEARLELVRERAVPWDDARAGRLERRISDEVHSRGAGTARLVLMGVASLAIMTFYLHAARSTQAHLIEERSSIGSSLVDGEGDDLNELSLNPPRLGDGGLEAGSD